MKTGINLWKRIDKSVYEGIATINIHSIIDQRGVFIRDLEKKIKITNITPQVISNIHNHFKSKTK